MSKAYIDSKNGAIIIHDSKGMSREELDVIYEAVTNAGYKCLLFTNDIEIEFLNSKIIDV